MAMAYGPLMVGMICRNAGAVSAKIEESLHAHTGNVFKVATTTTFVEFCHAADTLGPAASPSKNAAIEEELVRLRKEKKERDGELEELQRQMKEMKEMFLAKTDDHEVKRKKKKKKKKSIIED